MAKTVSVQKIQQGLVADGVALPSSCNAQNPECDGVWGPETELQLGRWLDMKFGTPDTPVGGEPWFMRPSEDGRTVTIQPTRAVTALETLARRFGDMPTRPLAPAAVDEHLAPAPGVPAVVQTRMLAPSKVPWIIGGVVGLVALGGLAYYVATSD